MRDGVLELRIPKPSQPQPRRIEIRGGDGKPRTIDLVMATSNPSAARAGARFMLQNGLIDGYRVASCRAAGRSSPPGGDS